MTNRKSVKGALAASIMAIMLCVVMLVGTTFAWFTDTAASGVNKIQAGNLGIELVDETGKAVETLSFVNKDDSTDILWEPGVTFHTNAFQVKNTGNLALKYKIEIDRDNVEGDKELLDVIDFSVVNAANVSRDSEAVNIDEFEGHLAANATADGMLCLQAHMDEAAGNTYQKMELSGIKITVYATQDTVEEDSYDHLYDENATYPVKDATGIASAVAGLATAGNKNVVVSVAGNVSGTSGIVTAKGNTFTLDMNGNAVGVNYGKGSANTTTNGMQLLQGSTVTLKNGTYKAEHGEDKDHNIAILIQNYSDLTVDSCTLDMREANDTAGNSKGTSYVLSSNCGNVTIKGNSNLYARSGEYALDVMHWENTSYKEEGTHVVFDETMTGTVDGKIDVYCYRDGRVVKPVDDGGATLVIMGGTFKNSGLTLEQFKAFVPAGYAVTVNGDGSFTVGK